MAVYEYEDLKKTYDNFTYPVAVLSVNGKKFSDNKSGFVVSDIEVELTSGYEASMVSFMIYNTFDQPTSQFRTEEVKKYIYLGSSVELALGYGNTAKEVFCGFITKVNFVFTEYDIPGIRVTAMDLKGVMMANNYAKQLTATNYGDAVKEILNKSPYMMMKSKNIIRKLEISDTPDKNQMGAGETDGQQKANDRTMDMVCESDYEFVVKAAKKYNYEFFTEYGTVYFRKAKADKSILMEISPKNGLMRTLDVEYDITGLVETIKTRGMDTGKGKAIEGKKKISNKISKGNKAKSFIRNSEKVYIDASITSQVEADSRAESLLEEVSYRFGTIECDCIGLPEMMPGHFIELSSVGSPPDNQFYVVNVKHVISDERGFETKIIGKTASIGGML